MKTTPQTLTKMMNIVAVTLSTIGAPLANATLTPSVQRGEKIVEIPVPGKRSEICVIPKHFPSAKYTEKDLENEGELCALNQYVNTAVCPKLESTNPGINWHSIPKGLSIQQVEAKNCEIPDPKDPKENLADKEAKYKLSISCSYTPSILGYYHMSRILGNIVNVPQAVLRTFDLERHLELGEIADRLAPQGDVIDQTWGGLVSHLKKGAASSKKDLLFTDDLDQSYGALTKNPKGEKQYKAFFNGGGDNHGRAAAFRDQNQIYQMVTNRAEAAKQVGRDFNEKNVQLMVAMKDAADFILLDTIMNQEDRFGNIHMVDAAYYFDQNDRDPQGNPKLKSKKKPKDDEIAKLGAVKVKEMMLKDNDCGVVRENVLKKAGLAERIAHIDPRTYKRVLKLDALADSEETAKFFKQGLMFTSSDWTSVRVNLKKVAEDLKKACVAGTLKLDLDLDAHFLNQPISAQSCEI